MDTGSDMERMNRGDRHFKVPSGTAEIALLLPSLTGLGTECYASPGNELPGYYLTGLQSVCSLT